MMMRAAGARPAMKGSCPKISEMPRKEPWEQRLDETDAHYKTFSWWLRQAPRPVPSDLVLARQYGWSDRAAAWDSVQDLPRGIDAQLGEGLENLTEAFALASRRMLHEVRTNPDWTIAPKDLASIGKSLASIQAMALEARAKMAAMGLDAHGESVQRAEDLIEGLSIEEKRLLLKMASKGA